MILGNLGTIKLEVKIPYNLFLTVGTQCLDPGEPTNGRRVMNDFTVGSRVYYIPNDGFESQQQTVLLCQENGHWDVDPPEFNITSAPCRYLN